MPIKAGNLFFESVSLSAEEVRPQRTVTVSAIVANGALAINPLTEPDACRNNASPCPPPGIFDTNGYCAEVEFNPSWTTPVTENHCINIAVSGVGTHLFQQTFAVPKATERVDVPIEVTLRGASGEDPEEETQTLTVTVVPEDGGDGGGNGGNGQPCGDDGECPDGQVCHKGKCVPGVLGLPRRQALIAGGGIGIGLGLILLSAGSDD